MTKPNYLVIGASKCGTSTLCTLIGKHPDVFMSRPKEPNFFCYDEVYARGFAWYESLFQEAAGRMAIGEGTTQYSQRTVWPRTIQRIVDYLPEIRIIYIVRHPLRRMESLWFQLMEGRHRVSYDFKKAIAQDRGRFIDSSNYWREINTFREFYPDERILVVFFEDFRQHPTEVLGKCFEFLGVDAGAKHEINNLQLNRSVGKRIEGRWAKRIRQVPGFPVWHKILPRPLRVAVRERLKHERSVRPAWDEDVRNRVVAELWNDIETFLSFYRKPSDYWKPDDVG